MADQPSSNKKDNDYLDMQLFTKEHFYLFPVIKYDYTGDDGHIIAVSSEVFDGGLSNAIDYTQGKALEEQQIQKYTLVTILPAVAMASFMILSGGIFNYIIATALMITIFLSIRKFLNAEALVTVMKKSFRDNRIMDKSTDLYKIATVKEIQSFNCPMDVSENLHQIPRKVWEEAGLGTYFAPQDMFSIIVLIALSSPITHNKTVSIVEDMIYATEEEKMKYIDKLLDLVMQKVD